MTAPAAVVELVARFESHREAYQADQYHETQLRREFIDPLFEALGWDVHNRQGYAAGRNPVSAGSEAASGVHCPSTRRRCCRWSIAAMTAVVRWSSSSMARPSGVSSAPGRTSYIAAAGRSRSSHSRRQSTPDRSGRQAGGHVASASRAQRNESHIAGRAE